MKCVNFCYFHSSKDKLPTAAVRIKLYMGLILKYTESNLNIGHDNKNISTIFDPVLSLNVTSHHSLNDILKHNESDDVWLLLI